MLDDRFRRVWATGRLPSLESFDPGDDAQLDALAELLLTRFRDEGDAEAFALLMTVTRGRLLQLARRLLARVARGDRPEDIVEGVMRRLFADRCRALPLVAGFLVLARGLMTQQLGTEPGAPVARPVSP